MTSTAMMWGLFAFYLLVAGVSAFERNLPRVGYFIGAALIIASTVKMRQS